MIIYGRLCEMKAKAGVWEESASDAEQGTLIPSADTTLARQGGALSSSEYRKASAEKRRRHYGSFEERFASLTKDKDGSDSEPGCWDALNHQSIRRNLVLLLVFQSSSLVFCLLSFLFDAPSMLFVAVLLVFGLSIWLLLREPAFRTQGCRWTLMSTNSLSVVSVWLYVLSAVLLLVGAAYYFEVQNENFKKSKDERRESAIAVELAMSAIGIGFVFGSVALWVGGAYCCNPPASLLTEKKKRMVEMADDSRDVSTEGARKQAV